METLETLAPNEGILNFFLTIVCNLNFWNIPVWLFTRIFSYLSEKENKGTLASLSYYKHIQPRINKVFFKQRI